MSMMQQFPRRAAAGISLIEVLVSLAAGLIVLTAVVGVMVSSNKTNVDSLRMTRLNQELRAAMSLMTRDIRREQYQGDWAARVAADPNAGPKDNVGNFPRITVTELQPNEHCILYSYDADADAKLKAAAPNAELFGFRLNGGAVERGTTVTACNAGTWEDITDPQTVTITALTFALNDTEQCIETTVGGVHKKELSITLRGQLAGDATVTREIVDGIRPRNDDYQIHPVATPCANGTVTSP